MWNKNAACHIAANTLQQAKVMIKIGKFQQLLQLFSLLRPDSQSFKTYLPYLNVLSWVQKFCNATFIATFLLCGYPTGRESFVSG